LGVGDENQIAHHYTHNQLGIFIFET
jgi:ADP-glucose pyrophosphorylase